MGTETLALGLSLAGAIAGLIAWFRNLTRERYGQERALAHLQRNHEQITQFLTELDEKVEDLQLEIVQIKVLMQMGTHDQPQLTNSKLRTRRTNGH